MSINSDNLADDIPSCPACIGSKVVKNGTARHKQRFKCKDCNTSFVIPSKHVNDAISDLGHLLSAILLDKLENKNTARYDIGYLAKALNFEFNEANIDRINSTLKSSRYEATLSKYHRAKDYYIDIEIENVRIGIRFGDYIFKGE